jgi:hypothetical protein
LEISTRAVLLYVCLLSIESPLNMRMRSLGLSGSLGQSILLMHTLNWLAFDFSFKPLLFVYAAYMQTRKEGRKEGRNYGMQWYRQREAARGKRKKGKYWTDSSCKDVRTSYYGAEDLV